MNEKQEGKKGVNPVAIIIVAVSVAIVLIAVFAKKSNFELVVAGTQAIDFELPDLDGKERSLGEFKGKVVFLNFWATWCKPCEDEMPSMQQLHAALQGKPFEIVAVSIDKDGPEAVREFVKKYGVTFTVLHDRKGRIKELYKTTGVPETFIIDQNGVIAEKVMGPRDWTKMSNISAIAELLQNGPKDPASYRR
ncbi:MAG TPA: TlpA disulfide reductase family protein [Thermodesulfobacteriota bacterium]|nr:TlpA disulfide reductase family protein [Thermodesulfobacteriota bacterium]